MENEIDERGTDVERYTPDYIYIYSCLGYTNTGDRRFFPVPTLVKFHCVEQKRSTHQLIADTPCYTLQTTRYQVPGT